MRLMLENIEKQIANYSEMHLRAKRWDQVDLSEKVRLMKNRYTPATLDYFLELNPSFIFEYRDLENLAEYPIVMLRDGYLGIFYFFAKHAKPLKNMKTLLLIPKKFSSLVSKFWEKNVLFYTIENTQTSEHIEHVYIYGALTIDNFINKTIPQKVEEISQLVPANSKVSVLNSFKHNYLFEHRNEIEYAVLFQREMYRKIGFEIEYLDEYKTEYFQSLDETCGYIDIDTDKFIINDHYFNHYFAARGAIDLRKKEQAGTNILKTIKLSPYHQVNIESADEKAFSFDILNEIIELKIHSIPIEYLNYDFYQRAKNLFKNYTF